MELIKLLIVLLVIACGFFVPRWVYGMPSYVGSISPIVGIVVAMLLMFFWTKSGRRLLVYFKESWGELGKVVWPERGDTLKKTFFVLMFSMAFTLFIYGVDSVISLLFNMILVRG